MHYTFFFLHSPQLSTTRRVRRFTVLVLVVLSSVAAAEASAAPRAVAVAMAVPFVVLVAMAASDSDIGNAYRPAESSEPKAAAAASALVLGPMDSMVPWVLESNLTRSAGRVVDVPPGSTGWPGVT